MRVIICTVCKVTLCAYIARLPSLRNYRSVVCSASFRAVREVPMGAPHYCCVVPIVYICRRIGGKRRQKKHFCALITRICSRIACNFCLRCIFNEPRGLLLHTVEKGQQPRGKCNLLWNGSCRFGMGAVAQKDIPKVTAYGSHHKSWGA